jgi:acyl-homoserine lactone acylase PvdQ
MKNLLLLLLLPTSLFAQVFTTAEIGRWKQQATQITIIRDNWGIPHIYGKTDADAVFGLMYAQCEDDFKRIEMNYIEKLGRVAELRGMESLYSDLYIRLIIDSAEAVADFQKSPAWLKKILQAYADGINYYLHKNPSVKPALLTRFKPWYPLLWTDGSIGAINTAGLSENDVRSFYGNASPIASTKIPEEIRVDGSNGFAIAPSKSATGNAILYINPHTTFYFRPEVHVVSQEGLNAYGAVTWGQFFIYQGFNQYCGWMHTSTDTDVADIYTEKIVVKNKVPYYQYNNVLKPLIQKKIKISYKRADSIASTTITAYYTHHGPVMGKRNGQWVSVRSYNRSMNGLMQCWLRNKAKGLEDYKKVMALRGNTSNNTVFADSKGNIAYWHGNYIPKRDPKFDWSKPVDGNNIATEWNGLHTVDETVHLYNPPNGWIQNCNSTPFTAAADNSPKKQDYPFYMAPDGENFRGINAVRVLSKEQSFTLDKVIAAGYDTYLSAFEILVPALIKAFEKDIAPNNPLYAELIEPINTLKNWNFYSDENSVATTVAIEWAQKLNPAIQRVYIDAGESDQVSKTRQFAATATTDQLVNPLKEAITVLKKEFGSWNISWGSINRFQRLTGNLLEKFDDNQPSLPVGFASATWGCLPSFVSRYMNATKKRYGYNGNSFVCAVEFGKRITAKSVLAGGVSGNPNSPHFTDQAELYTKGQFKDILFYKEDVMKHVERKYRPGE